MNRKSYLFARCASIGVVAVLMAATASARTVYDAGKALRENCTSGTYANPYGVWSYDLADTNGGKTEDFTAHGRFTHNNYGGASGAVLDGFTMSTSEQGRSVRVNVSGKAVTLSIGETIEIDELIMFPANSNDQYAHVRFTAPESGWYSAYVFVHDLMRGAIDNTAGVELRVLACGSLLISQVVSQEDRATKRFDFQMPVRYLAAGETIDVLVGRNGGNSNDNTGVRFFVTKEDEGAFYDSGIAMTNNLQTAYSNPYGTIKDGTWYYLRPTVPGGVDFTEWAPNNFSYAITNMLATHGTRPSAGNERGFANDATAKSPYLLVNEGVSADAAGIAPCELHAHPNPETGWTTLRFRPPVSGFYSGSIVVRDAASASGGDGVKVYLNIADHVVASTNICLETFSATGRLTFGPRLLAVGEPVDIIVSPLGSYSADATGISAIFRREAGDVYDASTAFAARWASGNTSHPFPDLLGGGATWDVGAKTNAYVSTQFYSMPASKTLAGSKLNWCIYASGTGVENGNLPRIALATNGVASTDSKMLMGGAEYGQILCAIPNELFFHPNSPNVQSASTTVRAAVPVDGIYTARAHARDLNTDVLMATPNNADGVRFSLSMSGRVPATAHISLDTVKSAESSAEASIEGRRLWLKAGEKLDVVVDPLSKNSNDGTGVSMCYAKESDATAHVINIDICGSDDKYVGVGREGWSNWTKWNYMRFSGSVAAFASAPERTLERCREADGTTKRNVAFTLKRDSGSDIDKGWSPTGYTGPALLRIWAKSTGPSDTYTFKLSKLKANEPYTLYLYSSKGTDSSGNAVDGNAKFTVGGVTKSADETWNMRDAKVLTRFDVTADANGEITGTFAAGNADTSSLATSLQGGAFNGLTLVGAFPDYVPKGATVVIR